MNKSLEEGLARKIVEANEDITNGSNLNNLLLIASQFPDSLRDKNAFFDKVADMKRISSVDMICERLISYMYWPDESYDSQMIEAVKMKMQYLDTFKFKSYMPLLEHLNTYTKSLHRGLALTICLLYTSPSPRDS